MDPLFKVGQKVTVKRRKKFEDPIDYPLSFVDGMAKFADTKVTIKEVYKSGGDYSDRKFSCYHDGYIYLIEEATSDFYWSSSMFKETYEL